MEAYRSVIVEAFRDRFTVLEFLSYNEVLFEEATEEWYAPHREKCNCIRLAEPFGHLMEEYREWFFTYVLIHSSTRSIAAHLETYLLHMHHTSQLN